MNKAFLKHTKDCLLIVMASHNGKEKGVHITALQAEMNRVERGFNVQFEQRQIRFAIEALRDEGHHICGRPNDGYYIADTTEELEETCDFLLSRSLGTLKRVAAMKKISVPDLYGQLNLLLEAQE